MRVVRCGGWDNIFRMAMPVTILPEEERALQGEGMYPVTDPEIAEPNTMPGIDEVKKPKTRIKEIAGQINLPRILFPTAKNLIEINGTEYYLVDIKAPTKSNPEGTIYLMNIATGRPEKLPVVGNEERVNQIKADRVRAAADKINVNIKKWNNMVDKVGGVANPSTWPLQLAWATDVIDQRISDIQSMLSSIGNSVESTPEKSEPYDNMIDRMEADLRSGAISDPQDQIDTIMFIHNNNQSKAAGIASDPSVPLGGNVRTQYFGLAGLQQEGEEAAKAKRETEDYDRQQRLDSPMPDYKVPELPKLEEIQPDDSGKYPKSDRYFGRPQYTKQMRAKIIGLERDMTELSSVRTSLDGMRDFIGRLAKGERSQKFLASEDERAMEVRMNISSFIEKSKDFLKRYSSNVFIKDENTDEYRVNPLLFGNSTGMGNGPVAVALNQILNVVRNGLKGITPAKPIETEGLVPEEMMYESKDILG